MATGVGMGRAVAVQDDPVHTQLSHEYAIRDLQAMQEVAAADMKACALTREAAAACADVAAAERATALEAVRVAAQEEARRSAEATEAALLERLRQVQQQTAELEAVYARHRLEAQAAAQALSEAGLEVAGQTHGAEDKAVRADHALRGAEACALRQRCAEQVQQQRRDELAAHERSQQAAQRARLQAQQLRAAAQYGDTDAAGQVGQTNAALVQLQERARRHEEARAAAAGAAERADALVREAVERAREAAAALRAAEADAAETADALNSMKQQHGASLEQERLATAALQTATQDEQVREAELRHIDALVDDCRKNLGAANGSVEETAAQAVAAQELAQQERGALDSARGTEQQGQERYRLLMMEAQRTAAVAQASENSLIATRATEVAAGQAHQAAVEMAAAQAQSAALAGQQLEAARGREHAVQKRSAAAGQLASAAEAEVAASVGRHQLVAGQRHQHEASPRRHKITLYDAPIPGAAQQPAPQTVFNYAAHPVEAADRAIARSPSRATAVMQLQ